MQAFIRFAFGLLLVSAFGSTAFAEAKKGASPPAVQTTRYFQFSSDLMGDLPVDGFLKEVRQGARVVSAVLDVCHSITQTDPRKDRFVINLKAEGEKLTGSGSSQEDKVPVTVNLSRTQSGKSATFTGSITRGQTKMDVTPIESSELNEEEFRESQPAEDLITDATAGFADVSPRSLLIRIKREALIGLVNELKAQRAAVELDSLVPGCDALRSGRQDVRAEIDPDRSPALVAKLKTLPGVVNAGWTTGDYTIENAVRIPAAAWRGGDGKLDKNRLASSIAGSIAKALEATLDGTSWDDTRGELTLKLSRAYRAVPTLNLTDTIVFAAIVSPEKVGNRDASIVWLRYVGLTTADRGSEPRLELAGVANDRERAPPLNMDEMVILLARDLKGQHWDATTPAWR